MPEAWKQFEGRVVNKEFRLGEYLGGSEYAGVFVTQYGPESRKAAVKLIPVGNWDQAMVQAELSRLQSARELSHPHLLQIFQAGRAKLDDAEMLFVVMECAEENLSQFLPERALTAGEVREMLKPTLDALSYLHQKGLLHGHLKPSNVMAIGDQLKLSSDGISRIGEKRGLPGESSDNDPPESAWGERSAVSDIWSLGMLLAMMLTQRMPTWDAKGEEPILPENIPAPFNDVARHCLRVDARARWTPADIAARLGFASPVTPVAVPKPNSRQSATARASAGPQLVGQQKKATPAPQHFPYKGRWNSGTYIAAATVLAIVAIFVGPRLFRNGHVDSQTDATRHERSTSASRSPAGTNSRISPVSDQKINVAERSEADSAAAAEKPEKLPAPRGKALRGLTAGQVAEQVLPEVPQSARDTIRGTVRVGVRISVDSAGNVTEAELDSPGPSKYFAHLALDAAQQWKFDPPKVQARSVLSDWLLHFQFTGKETKVTPVQIDP
jgi:TonB family protein